MAPAGLGPHVAHGLLLSPLLLWFLRRRLAPRQRWAFVNVETASKWEDLFSIFQEAFSPDHGRVVWTEFRACSSELPNPSEFDGIIVSGSHYNVTDEADHPWMASLFRMLREAHAHGAAVRTVGVCFGCQAIAHALGGEVRANEASPRFRYGATFLQVADELRRASFPTPRWVLKSHGQSVARLPPGARLLASSETTPYESFVVGNMLAVQFHPEFVPKLMTSRISIHDKLSPAECDTALQSLGQHTETDVRLARDWIVAYLERRNNLP